MTTLPKDIGSRLAELRVEAGMTQAIVAPKVRVDQSRISRFEKGEALPSFTEAQTYLQALDTEEAHDYLLYLEMEWKVLSRPAPNIPELEDIWVAEQKLQVLEAFGQEKDLPSPVKAEIDMHEHSLCDAADFLSRLDHQISFIRDIGVGKTTAVCVAARLILPGLGVSLPSKVALETGSGRVTICEVRIKAGPAWGLIVYPHEEGEIYKLVQDLCEAIMNKSGLGK